MTITIAELLLPELEGELAKTRKVLANVPEGNDEFKSHPKSRTLASLAGHTADLVGFLEIALTQTEFDFGTEHRMPLVMVSREQVLAAFDEKATRTMVALRAASNEALLGEFRFLFNGRQVFAGTRYTAYRVNCLDHIIHHRAQMGVYLRLLGERVPATYGPSADEFY